MRVESGGNVESLMAPTAGFGTSSERQSYVKVDGRKLDGLATALRTDTMAKYVATNG